MVLKRREIVLNICRKIGIRQRAKPDCPTLSKHELMTLNTWVDTMAGIRRRQRERERDLADQQSRQ